MKVIDFHCDTLLQLMRAGEDASLCSNSFSVDLGKMRAGGVAAQFFACYVDQEVEARSLERALLMIDRFYQELKGCEADIRVATCYDDWLSHQAEGVISAFLTLEEGGVLQGRLEYLRLFYRLGVRLITLTWNYPNEIGFPHTTTAAGQSGLTPFGREVVAEMNRLGMLIDVSHLSDQGFYEVAALSAKPFVASHSNARAVTGHTRNLTDDMLRVLSEKGGVAGLNFSRNFLGQAGPSNRIEDMVRHVRHMVNTGGIEAVAIGSDFDGIDPAPPEVPTSGELPRLTEALADAGFTEDEIEKICWRNALRVIRDTLK